MQSSSTPNLYVSGVRWDKHSVLALLPLIDCKGCGKCCRECRLILVQDYEVDRIATHTKKSANTLKRRWEKLPDGWSLPSPCPYRDGIHETCEVYEARPVVCKYFPLQRVKNEGHECVGVTIGFCHAGDQCIAKLMEWQHGN